MSIFVKCHTAFCALTKQTRDYQNLQLIILNLYHVLLISVMKIINSFIHFYFTYVLIPRLINTIFDICMYLRRNLI